MGDPTLRIEHHDDRMGDPVGIAPARITFVEETKLADYFGFRICNERHLQIAAALKTIEEPFLIIGYRCYVIAKSFNLIDLTVPGDRLDDAVGSPIERSGEQQNKTLFSAKGLKGLGGSLMVSRTF